MPIRSEAGACRRAMRVRAVDDLAASPAFEETFDNTRSPFSGRDIAVPVTVAFGDRDWILAKAVTKSRRASVTCQVDHEARWGHVPMWVDPVGVSALILEGTR